MKKNKVLWISMTTYNYTIISDKCYQSIDKVVKINNNYEHVFKRKGMTLKPDINKWLFCTLEGNSWLSQLDGEINSSDFDYIIRHDCDITFFEKSWDELFEYIDNSDKWIFFMREESQQNQVNGGFCIIKGDHFNEFSDILKVMLNEGIEQYPYYDQSYFNIHKDSLFKYDYIPDKYVVWANLTNSKNKNNILMHHAVCESSIEGKLKQMEEVTYWHDN
jgi:hypothetical protein